MELSHELNYSFIYLFILFSFLFFFLIPQPRTTLYYFSSLPCFTLEPEMVSLHCQSEYIYNHHGNTCGFRYLLPCLQKGLAEKGGSTLNGSPLHELDY